MIGQTVGKYRIVERLGRGGMGTVYKAVDETLDRDVAIKVLNPGLAETEVLKRFRAEAMALAKLNHQNIATIYELSKQDDELLMVIEFIRGETFDKLLERTGPMSFERAAHLCGQVLDALGHAHRARIIHRDLKPANLMVSETGVVKVMDFGIARMAGAEHLTNDGFMMGTPAYMAPEQVMGHDLDGRADLYSIAVVLYRLLTGNLPFQADSAIAMAQKQIKDPPTPLRQFRAELPVWCEQILMKGLSKDPADRYQTAEEFRAAITLSVAMAPTSDVTSVLAKATGPYPIIPPEGESGAAPSRTPLGIPPSVPPAAAPSGAVSAWTKTEEQTIVFRKAHVATAGGIVAGVLIAIVAGVVVMTRRDSPPPAPPVTATTPDTAPPAPLPSGVAASSPGAGEPSRPAAADPAPAPAAEAPRPRPFPALVFTPVRLLVVSGRARERDATLRLDGAALRIVDPRNPREAIESVPYSSVIGLFRSRSREPRWVRPNGDVIAVAKTGGGMFGFLKGDHDWLTIRTQSDLIAVRADGAVLKRIAAALEERTNARVVAAETRQRPRD